MPSLAVDHPGASSAARVDGRLFCFDAGLAFCAALAVPVAFYAAGFGGLNRLFYPALAALVGLHLIRRQSPWFVGFCIWVFCAAPLIRRLTDLATSWDPTNPVLLAPYLATLCAVGSFAPYVLRPRAPFAGTLVLMLMCLMWGLLLAVLDGRVTSGMVDAMKWGIGPVFAAYLLSRAGDYDVLFRTVTNAFLVAGPPMGLYGVLQYMEPQLWDREWMINVVSLGLTSIGGPAAFEIRVFSTMNSPGSFAAVMMIGLILLLRQPMPVGALCSVPLALGLALAQYRAVWAGTVLGIFVVLLAGPAREKARIAAVAVALAFCAGSLAVVPEIANTLTARFESLQKIGSDASGEDRLSQYQDFLTSDERLIVGEGLAISGAARQLDGRNSRVIDSGIIETINALGIVVGTAFLLGLAGLAVKAVTGRGRGQSVHLCRAVVVASLVQLPFGTIHAGETGFWTWLFIGLSLAGGLPHGQLAGAAARPSLVTPA